jgi:drug/metabolite transporter (DMT)-like permease
LRENLKISKSDFLWVSAVGIINVVITMNLLQLSLYVPDAKASVAAVIVSSNPIFVSIFAALFDKEKINKYRLIGLAVVIIGIIIIFFNKLQISQINYMSPLLASASSITFALYTVLARKVSVRIGSLKTTSYSFIIGSAVLLIILIFMRRPIIGFDYSGMPQVMFLGFLGTGIAYFVFFKGLSIVGSGKGSLVFFIKPVCASILAILFLNEEFSLNLLFGTILIIFGIVIAKNTKLQIDNS